MHALSPPSLRGAKPRSNPESFPSRDSGLLRGACHRAALRADPVARNDGVRGTRRSPPTRTATRRHAFASSRLISPELCIVPPSLSEGAGKTGCRPGTHGPLCERWQQESAQRHTGEAKHPAFPAQWFYDLCRVLPGERCTIAPVALRMADARTRSGRHITARLDAQIPGARTTRFCRTRTASVVCALAVAHGCPPRDALRADAACVHRSSPRVSRRSRYAPLTGMRCGHEYAKAEFR
ncbi:hypothetical protein ABIF44_000878 [Bradyrhizobium japonicum]|jgi:hypothetical protein|nr:hypothetical protein [Bradyrhizobium japonicum]MCS3992819.1 hypothetical protein [Bradyrhizobium japonicum]MCS4021249.1 hypothetical protein [Bradyrhizobium japonicum]MCS4208358.1 hypothetical protein [Bradyrhizobium japonicum]MDH6173125.1 hypothetical protein [Bradyrhizobium japonicum]